MNKKEIIAFLGYMINHNDHHAQELMDTAAELYEEEKQYLETAAKQIRQANVFLEAAIKKIDRE